MSAAFAACLEVAACAKRAVARARNDAHALLRVGCKIVERRLQLEVHRLVQRVHDLRPIQGYRGEVIARLRPL
jgi:hypothetical protein